MLPNMISPIKPAEIAEGGLATSDNGHCVNFGSLDFPALPVVVQPGDSLSAAPGISPALMCGVCGGLGVVGPGVHSTA